MHLDEQTLATYRDIAHDIEKTKARLDSLINDRNDLIKLLAGTYSLAEIGRAFGLTYQAVQNIIRKASK